MVEVCEGAPDAIHAIDATVGMVWHRCNTVIRTSKHLSDKRVRHFPPTVQYPVWYGMVKVCEGVCHNAGSHTISIVESVQQSEV